MQQNDRKYTPKHARSLLKQCKQENITYEMALTAMEDIVCEDLIQFVPVRLRTEELCLCAIKFPRNLGFVYSHIPEDIITPEFALKAVKANGLILEFLSPDLITEQIAIEAIKNNPTSIKYVPQNLITQAFYEQIIAFDKTCLKYIPKQFKTKEFFLKAVEYYPFSIKYIKKDELDYEICKCAVSKNWQVLRLIPEMFKADEICEIAFKANKRAAKYVSEKFKTPELCLLMVKKNPEFILECPKDLMTEEFCIQCIEANWECIKYIPNDFKTQKLCNICVEKNANAISFISSLSEDMCLKAVEQDASILKILPDECKTQTVCEYALKLSWENASFVPEIFRTKELYLSILRDLNFSSNFKCWLLGDKQSIDEQYLSFLEGLRTSYNAFIATVRSFSPDIISNTECAILERELGLRKVIESEYDGEKQLFLVNELFCGKRVNREFEIFDEYYQYLGGNLIGANLIEYSFKDIDVEKYKLEGAILSSTMLIKQGTYDESFYVDNIFSYAEEVNFLPVLINETVPACAINHAEIFNDKLNAHERKIYYISDLHLNHRLIKAYPTCATYEEVRLFIRKIVRKMLSSYKIDSDDFLLIGGDVSFCFEISKIFYSELAKLWRTDRIIVVLGNHELWNFNRFGNKEEDLSLNEITEKYSNLFNELKIIFLHNSLFIGQCDGYCFQHYCKIEYDKLLSLSIDDLKKIGLKSNLLIFGGLGFSGYNSNFNASNGIYRQTITTIDKDLNYTRQFESIYLKLVKAFPNDNVVVFTHTPKEDWTADKSYNPNWIFVNGHTHKNYYIQDEDKTIYADNQIGYSSMNYNLKYFKISKDYDIFKDYPDGTHTITKEQYLEFNYGIGIRLSFNRDYNEILMLKRNGYYLFLAQNSDKTRLYLLNGGIINKLKNTDVNYYFQNMTKYGEAIKSNLKSYNAALKLIAEKVKLLGGDGTVHGCIIDIDFYNHIYLNPVDGSITPYYSPMFGAQQVYSDIPKLLEVQCPKMFQEYLKLSASNNTDFAVEISKATPSDSIFVYETEHYRPSRFIKSLQFITENKVIRLWNEDFIAGKEVDFSEEIKLIKNKN